MYIILYNILRWHLQKEKYELAVFSQDGDLLP